MTLVLSRYQAYSSTGGRPRATRFLPDARAVLLFFQCVCEKSDFCDLIGNTPKQGLESVFWRFAETYLGLNTRVVLYFLQ